MKFNFSFLVLILSLTTLTIFSCKKDKDPTLVGNWIPTELSDAGCDDPDDNESFTFDENGQTCGTDSGIEFCISQRFEVTNTQITITTTETYTQNGMTNTDTSSDVSTYTISGNTITICEDGDCEDSTLTLTDNTFTIVGLADEDGCVFTVKGKRA